MAVASAALVACIWCVPYIPTNDGPQVALTSHIQNHYGDPGSVFPDQVVPNFAFTHLGFGLLFTPLEDLLPWRDALRLTLTASALAMAWAIARLVSAIDPRRRALGLLGFVFATTWSFYMGFFSYEIATALGLALIAHVAHATRAGPLRGVRAVVVAVGLFAVAAAHVFAATWTGLAILAVMAGRAPRGARLREGAAAVLVGAPAAGLFVAAWAQRAGLSRVALTSSFRWVAPGAQLLRLPRLILPGPGLRAVAAVALVVVSVGAAFARWKEATPVDRALAILAAVLLAAGVFGPLDVPGWQFLSPRFLAPVPALAVALLPLERLAGPRRVAALSVVAGAAVAALAASAALHLRLHTGCADDLAGLDDPVKRTGYVLPVVLAPYCGVDRAPDRSEVPYLAPALHLGALYALAGGGTVPYLFAGSSAAYAFRLRDTPDARAPSIPDVARYWTAAASDAFRDDADFRARIVTELAVHGTSYEAIEAFGAQPRDVAVLERLGFVADRTRGALFEGTFGGCDASLELPAEATRAPLRLAWGVPPLEAPIVDRALPRAREGAGAVSLPLRRVPCRLWVRLTPPICPGADAAGRLQVDLTPGTRGTIDCAPGDASGP